MTLSDMFLIGQVVGAISGVPVRVVILEYCIVKGTFQLVMLHCVIIAQLMLYFTFRKHKHNIHINDNTHVHRVKPQTLTESSSMGPNVNRFHFVTRSLVRLSALSCLIGFMATDKPHCSASIM